MSTAETRSTKPWVRWLGYLLFAVVFAVACWALSQWQFDRMTGREADIARIEANYDAAPIAFAEAVDVASAEFDPQTQWRRVTLTGTYIDDTPIFVRHRPHGGSSAFEVLQPLRTSDGTVVIVNRGWVPPGVEAQPEFTPVAPSGVVTVNGHILPSEPPPSSRRGADAGQVPNINLDLVAEYSGAETLRTAYVRAESEVPAPAEALGGFEVPSTDSGPHLSYAIQWLLFAVMGFVFIGYVIRTELQNYREGRGLDEVRTKKRRDRDAEAEDALLDAE